MSAPRVLVADDDPGTRRLVQFILSADGFQVDLAGGGEEAIDKARTFRPDVLILDIEMPDLDGREVFFRLQAANICPKVLIFSVEMAAEICRELVADDSLQKPFVPELLVEKVETLTRHAPRQEAKPSR